MLQDFLVPPKTNNVVQPQDYEVFPLKEESKLQALLFDYPDNPLIAMGGAIFVIVAQMRRYQLQLRPAQLREFFLNEIVTFEKNLVAKGIHSKTLLEAKYVLCAILDEAVINQFIETDNPSVWSQNGLVSTFFQDAWGGEQFFNIANNALSDAKNNLHLLELILLCLNLGFTGKYLLVDKGFEQLAILRQKIFDCVTSHVEISKSPIGLIGSFPEIEKQKGRLPAPLFIISTTLLLLLAIFISFNIQLNRITQPIIQAIIQGD